MKKIKLCFVIAAALISLQAVSQVSYKGRPSLSLGAEVGIPTGSFNDAHNVGLGGSLKALFPIFEGGALTLSGGYISFSGDEIGNTGVKREALNFLPIKAGLRYNLSPGGVYLEPQLGYTSINTANSNSSATGGFTYAGNLGVMVQAIDLSVRYEAVSRDGFTWPHVGLRAAYNFKL